MHRLIFLFFGLLPVFLHAQLNTDSLDRWCRRALDSLDTPGFAIGVIKDGEVVFAKGYGVREKGKSEAVDANTLFAIASNTKAFTAVALATLAAEDKLLLDDPVRKYLPDFAMYDPYVSEHINIRDLLSHRAGLGTFSGDVIWYKSQLTAAEVIQLIRYLPQAYEFRAGYGYSNLMFITAGEVLAQVAGKPWHEWLKERVFTPLGMSRTVASVSALKNMDNVATPHITLHDNQPIPYAVWDNMGAAGGLISSVNDMLRWMEVQLNEGKFRDKGQVLPHSIFNEVWKPHNPIGGSQTFSSYGLGYSLLQRENERIARHGGGYDGMYSNLIMAPDMDLGIVVLTNGMTGLASSLSNYVLNRYLGVSTDGWLSQAAAGARRGEKSWNDRRQTRLDARLPKTQPTLPLSSFAGRYHDPLYGDITVKDTNGKLSIHFSHAPALDADLSHWHDNTFRLDWREPHAWFDFGTVRFVLDNNRKVTGIRFDVPNDDIFFEEIEAERE